MDRRFVLFLVLSFGVLMLSQLLFPPPRPPVDPAAELQQEADDVEQPAAEPEPADRPPEEPREVEKDVDPPAVPPPARDVPLEYVTLGSVDPESGYRMLLTLTNRGAAVERLELSSRRYRDVHDRGGYLGHVASSFDGDDQGVLVRAVGAGTPAAQAGLQPGDRIIAFEEAAIKNQIDLSKALVEHAPGDTVALNVKRGDEPSHSVPVTLARRPLEVIRPERENVAMRQREPAPDFPSPPSFLLTLASHNGVALAADETSPIDESLMEANWEIAEQNETSVTFRRALPELGLEVIKRYRLKAVPDTEIADPNFPGYDFDLDLELRNTASEPSSLAYRLAGPNGLPIEGWWYSTRIGREWFTASGLRDAVLRYEGASIAQFSAKEITEGDVEPMGHGASLAYIGVDSNYFAAVMLPKKDTLDERWIDETNLVRVSPEPEKNVPAHYTNVSFRVDRESVQLAAGESLRDSYRVFAGPKRPELLKHYYAADNENYQLGDLLYYGWFGPIAEFMLSILHFFYGLVGNYGIAIIMLTVVVRGCLFPLSLKQTQNMARMQALKPEMDRITEKYKTDMQKRSEAMQELYRKHKVNPLAGCLPMFVQLPILIGLYRALMVDVELRQSPLFSDAIRWCSNLAAPDMFLDWSSWMPSMVTNGIGIFGLGPYLNVLPLVTVVLFLVSQKMFMPEPTNDQAKMQQSIMKYMTVFMGLIFYKVASGLCLYFITSSLWGIAERKLLPKISPPAEEDGAAGPSPPSSPSTRKAGSDRPTSQRNGSPKGKKRQKSKKKR